MDLSCDNLVPPVSVICSMWFSLSALILMDSSSVALRADLSVSERNRILSKASEALDINSRRKICAEEEGRSCDNHVQGYKHAHISHVTTCTKVRKMEEERERKEKNIPLLTSLFL